MDVLLSLRVRSNPFVLMSEVHGVCLVKSAKCRDDEYAPQIGSESPNDRIVVDDKVLAVYSAV